jgi:hypothetical protein
MMEKPCSQPKKLKLPDYSLSSARKNNDYFLNLRLFNKFCTTTEKRDTMQIAKA